MCWAQDAGKNAEQARFPVDAHRTWRIRKAGCLYRALDTVSANNASESEKKYLFGQRGLERDGLGPYTPAT